jgi:hypothetical protein
LFALKKLLSLLLILTIVGCSEQGEHVHNEEETQDNSLRYVVGSNEWPAVINQFAKEQALEAYQFALDHPEVLDFMPCYCGCYEDAGHVSNIHCFVRSVNDGVAELDPMGVG